MMLVEKYKIIQGFESRTTNAAISSAYVNLKNVITAVVIINLTQAVGHATEVSLYQAQDIEGKGAKTLTNNVILWANEDVVIEEYPTRKADGISYTVANTAKNKQVIFHVNPAKLDVNNGFCCLGLKIGASSQPTNFACGEFILDMKYGEAKVNN